MNHIKCRIKELGIDLPGIPAKAGLYAQCKVFGENFVYLSGCGPDLNGEQLLKGKVGAEISMEEGQLAARNCAINALAILEKHGLLCRVKRFAKALCFVASANDFYLQPTVANGASQLLIDVFGEEAGCPARSAIGVNVLPGNIPVEIEYLVELTI